MRYSILRRPTETYRGSWIMAKTQSFGDYRAELFDDTRLTQRLLALKQVVLPSLLAQTMKLDPRWHRLILFTSSELPRDHLKALEKTVEPYPWVRIVFSTPDEFPDYRGETGRFLQEIGAPPGPVATCRLDDDDALAKIFIQRLSTLVVSRNLGKVITFPNGFVGEYDAASGGFAGFYRSHKPFTAQGLAAVETYDGTTFSGKTIYGFGNHAQLGKKQNFLSDGTFPSYIRTIYPEQDSAARGRELSRKHKVSAAEVATHVGLPASPPPD